jgi:hypothetical protein
VNALADTFRNADPASVDRELEDRTTDLDTLGKSLDAAVERFNVAEEKWDEAYDAVEESLKDEYLDARPQGPAVRGRDHFGHAQAAPRRSTPSFGARSATSTRSRSSCRPPALSSAPVRPRPTGLRDEMKMGAYSR